jgi:hypothetical protein
VNCSASEIRKDVTATLDYFDESWAKFEQVTNNNFGERERNKESGVLIAY